MLTAAPARPPPSPGRLWPVVAAVATLLVATMPWAAVRAGWCHPDAGACTVGLGDHPVRRGSERPGDTGPRLALHGVCRYESESGSSSCAISSDG